MRPTYCTRDDVKSALDIRETARANQKIDRHIVAASESVEKLCHRVFYPHITTRYFEWPDPARSRAWRLYLAQHDLISVSDLGVRGGASLSSSSYLLEPVNSGPPYTRVEIDTASTASGSFGGAVGTQRAVRITGTYGYRDESAASGTLGVPTNTSDTTITVTDSSVIGAGSTLVIGTERLVVSGKTLADTGATLSTALTASAANVGVVVSDPSLVEVGESILIDTERMIVDDKAGSTLLVRRAVDGSVLAAHSGSAVVYAPRFLAVERGALGTTAAVHNEGDEISVVTYPQLIQSLAIAESLNGIQQDNSGWARVVGSGDNERESSGKGLADLRDRVYWAYGRTNRKLAV